MSFRDDLDAISARHDALATEVAHKTRELEASTRMLDEAKARMRLPILDNLRVATPCPADWNAMTGDEQVRHCGKCDKSVFNLSGLNREEAETLIVTKQGNLCVRYFQRKDGTILLKDCEIGVSQKRKRKLIAAGAAVLLASSAAGVALRILDSKHPAVTEEDDDIHATAGAIRPTPMPPPRVTVESIHDQMIETRGQLAMPHDDLVKPAPPKATR